jgi:ring-1,2-phenylacetyl-CoA epoxidase subunit PaaC
MPQALNEHAVFVLRLADTNLIWSHRIGEWCGHGPVLEEDIALANIGLDTLGQARLLLQHVAALEGKGRSEDDFAYWRDDRAYCNVTLAELPKGDYAFTIVRNLVLSAYFIEVWGALADSKDTTLAGIAQKAVKESRYHFKHASDWTIRFGNSTPQARTRVEAAVTTVWRYAAELFEPDAVDEHAVRSGILPISWHELHTRFDVRLHDVLTEATLVAPAPLAFRSTGKRGLHSESLSILLAEMQSVARAHPGARW